MDVLTRRYCVMDIEGISLGKHRPQVKGLFSKIHYCNRKMALQCFDSTTRVFEFKPCVEFDDLNLKEQKTFYHCQKYFHHLQYEPSNVSEKCANSADIIRDYLSIKRIDLILFKGGTIERDLCNTLNIECRNLEDYGVGKYEGDVHDPFKEVIFFRKQFIDIVASQYHKPRMNFDR